MAIILLGLGYVQSHSDPITLTSTKATAQSKAPRARGPFHYPKRSEVANITVPLADYFDGTDLQWYGNISVGTPPQVLTVSFDTGSYSLEVESTQCDASCQNQVLFNVSASSTYVGSNFTYVLQFTTGIGVAPVVGNNTNFTVMLGTDVVSVGNFSVPKEFQYPVWTIINQSPDFEEQPISGVFGLSIEGEIFQALQDANYDLPRLFSFYLTPEKEGSAELIFGGIDNSKFRGDLMYAPLESGAYQWQLSSYAFYTNGKTSPALQTNASVIFDTGTSNVVFPTNVTEAIYAIISPDIRPYAPEPGAYGIECWKIDFLEATISTTFMSLDGTSFNLTIPTSELSVGPFADDPTICQTLINAVDGYYILGGSLLKHYYSVWDVGNQTMGFAPTAFHRDE